MAMTNDEIKALRDHCNTSGNPQTHVAKIIYLCDEVLAARSARAEVDALVRCKHCGVQADHKTTCLCLVCRPDL